MHGRKTFQRSIGLSIENREQVVHANFDLDAPVPSAEITLIIGGMHGDEIATVRLLEGFISRHLHLLDAATVVLPVCNPDGYARKSRYNARGVDLNRNCEFNWRADSVEPSGPHPWSEPEICALRDFILRWRPSKIANLHWALAEIDPDGAQSVDLARAMWSALNDEERRPYRLRSLDTSAGNVETLNTNCPGSLGQWCGHGVVFPDRSAPAMVTLELPYNPQGDRPPADLPEAHLAELWGRWETDAAGYLDAVGPAVEKMLLAACHHRRSLSAPPLSL